MNRLLKDFRLILKGATSTRFADAFRSFPRNGSSINPNTIQKAYSLLEQERYIYPVKGRGNFVSDTTLLVEQTKKTLLENVSRLIANGKELGVKRAEFTQLVDRIYRKEDSHDRVKNA